METASFFQVLEKNHCAAGFRKSAVPSCYEEHPLWKSEKLYCLVPECILLSLCIWLTQCSPPRVFRNIVGYSEFLEQVNKNFQILQKIPYNLEISQEILSISWLYCNTLHPIATASLCSFGHFIFKVILCPFSWVGVPQDMKNYITGFSLEKGLGNWIDCLQLYINTVFHMLESRNLTYSKSLNSPISVSWKTKEGIHFLKHNVHGSGLIWVSPTWQ